MVDIEYEKFLVFFFSKVGIKCDSLNELENISLPRDVLLDKERYISLKEEITKLKEYLSTSYFTSLHANAFNVQKWPLLNLVRQILRSLGYKLTPQRLCDGYTLDKKKKYKRIFIIVKYDNSLE